ncbi:unnamed protein product [Moneuplotes crassus]|uniref:t-SNARE coiled-coil homology domain-containing protein n=1 Tax=Euplotes crassus TaxID=5936 RepID=A0AAD2CYB4_EUPCR|nr:unnamed protein product [Moneuplotes crassus]
MSIKLGGPIKEEDLADSFGGLTNINSGKRYEFFLQVVKENLKLIQETLDERRVIILKHGYNSSERIIIDEDINMYIQDSQQGIQKLKISVDKDKKRLSPIEITERCKCISLLRKNLNLLIKQFKESAKDYIGMRRASEDRKMLLDDKDEYEGNRKLTEKEEKALEEFKKNDEELEEIALKIAQSLEELGDKQKKVGQEVGAQYEMLVQANADAENIEFELGRQNNELTRLLHKFRNGKQVWLDFLLIFLLCIFLTLLWNRLKAKDFI